MIDSSIREFVDNTLDPPIRGFLHTPGTSSADALVLTHSAGGNAQAPLLRALAHTFASAGFTVLRCNLPFRQAKSFGPPGPGDAARDRAGLKNAIAAVKRIVRLPASFSGVGNPDPPTEENGHTFLAGHSYGGRQSSVLCAEEPNLVSGLILLSYPLHPPRRPEQQRTQHLPDLRTPTLFVHGTRDPFGSILELERAIKMIPAKAKLLAVEGAGHDLGFKGKTRDDKFSAEVLEQFQKEIMMPR